MSKAGETIENPVTKERKVVRVGTEDCAGRLLTVDGYVQPGGAVAGERVHVPPGTAHDWWNAGQEEAHVAVEIRPGARYEEMALNLFGLAQNGQTNPKGMPGLFWAAIFAREFADV